ncbi:DUF3219 family protein [Neobacillus dielmonensis]|uniref:DUF3219 family protein n=1 Tax=Neobacillus dielmonensis TaxID=1347369 RepID=UPI0005A9C64E|nr:DUF3219 family protein [Neobacillus dielmonensis]
MVNMILLNDTEIDVYQYEEDQVNGLQLISVKFKVTSDQYHDITTLLYKGTFQVHVPEQNLSFTGTIHQYFTSFTNLYEKGQTGDFSLSLLEMKEGS